MSFNLNEIRQCIRHCYRDPDECDKHVQWEGFKSKCSLCGQEWELPLLPVQPVP